MTDNELRELDKEFEREVLGRYGGSDHAKHYTRDLSAAWEGIELLTQDPRHVLDDNTRFMVLDGLAEDTGRWRCTISFINEDYEAHVGIADHPAEAVVRACLEAVRKDTNEQG